MVLGVVFLVQRSRGALCPIGVANRRILDQDITMSGSQLSGMQDRLRTPTANDGCAAGDGTF